MVAYGEINKERPDIIQIEVGNIEPKKFVKIMFTYCQELEVSMNKFYLLTIPSIITSKYKDDKE
jgi:hypothetical protein